MAVAAVVVTTAASAAITARPRERSQRAARPAPVVALAEQAALEALSRQWAQIR
jgi:hypothetical protein